MTRRNRRSREAGENAATTADASRASGADDSPATADDQAMIVEALRESEDFLRRLFDNMPSGAAVYEVRGDGSRGSDYIVKYFNAASLRIEGKTRHEVVGKSLFDLRPTIDEYGLIPVFQRVWETGEPALFPTTFYSDEHYTKWYENHVFRLPSGEIVAVYDDVTERKQAEEEVRTGAQRQSGPGRGGIRSRHSLCGRPLCKSKWILAGGSVAAHGAGLSGCRRAARGRGGHPG
jgi:PAS domain S-box-containing protein